MRTLLKIDIPVQAGSRAVQDGTLAETVKSVFSQITPEAAYFSADSGVRTIHAVFDLADPTEICPTLEPFFMQLDASCELVPCMNQEELEAGMAKVFSRA